MRTQPIRVSFLIYWTVDLRQFAFCLVTDFIVVGTKRNSSDFIKSSSSSDQSSLTCSRASILEGHDVILSISGLVILMRFFI